MGFNVGPFTFEQVLFAVGVVVGGGWWSYTTLSKQTAEVQKQRLEAIQSFTRLAFSAINEIARRTNNKVDDKVALALKKINESLDAIGGTPLNTSEMKHVTQALDSLHYQEKTGRPSP